MIKRFEYLRAESLLEEDLSLARRDRGRIYRA
jgi:hypothetical protein